MDAFRALSLKGKDRHDFLHRLSSQSFLNFEKGQIRQGAFLNAMGGVLFLFEAQELGDETRLVTYADQTSELSEHLEKFHFSEDLSCSTLEKTVEWTQPEPLLPPSAKDMASAPILLELGLYTFFHPNKGCYPGQEVIERILTKGDVPKKAVFLNLESNPGVKSGEIFFNGARVGTFSSVFSADGHHKAYGFIQRLQLDQSRAYQAASTTARIIQMAGPLPRH